MPRLNVTRFHAQRSFAAARIALLGAGALLTAACAITTPETHYYVLSPRALESKEEPAPISVGFEGVQLSQLYAQEAIAYRESPYRIEFYHYHQWATAPELMVADAILKLLADSGRFQRVDTAPGPTSFDLVVRGQLREIYEDGREEPWKAVLTVAWEIRDGKTDALLANLTTSEQAPAEKHSSEAIVGAMSRAAEATAERLAEAIVQAAAKRPRPAS